jgi:hypothetical protein
MVDTIFSFQEMLKDLFTGPVKKNRANQSVKQIERSAAVERLERLEQTLAPVSDMPNMTRQKMVLGANCELLTVSMS